jgi:hypothetical protein|tara:strand:+ start:21325 stop:21624 length:300 start_codon:yes stop_codon:yes gene_type:complete
MANHISFDISPYESDLIVQILDRCPARLIFVDRMSLHMDLCATHANGNPMDFARLLAADDFNFAHDIAGIQNHLNRNTGKLENFFSPRFSARAKKSEAA